MFNIETTIKNNDKTSKIQCIPIKKAYIYLFFLHFVHNLIDNPLHLDVSHFWQGCFQEFHDSFQGVIFLDQLFVVAQQHQGNLEDNLQSLKKYEICQRSKIKYVRNCRSIFQGCGNYGD